MKFIKKGFTLRFTISLLVITAILLTLLTSIISAVQVNRSSLISNYLNKNESYAKKLASNTNDLLMTMQGNIWAVAQILEREEATDVQLIDDLFQENTQYFNSLVVADHNRDIQAISPHNVGVSIGDRLTSEQSKMAVNTKKASISEPYRATTGRLIILVSAPIFDKNGIYKGFVGGTIYLEEKNVLSDMLKEHFFGDGSYVYVVDKSGNLIFHPNNKRVGQSVIENEVAQKVISGQCGSQRVTNLEGNEFLAGYAYEPNSSWGIISQTPAQVVDKPTHHLVTRMLLFSLPFLLLILLLGWWIASRIAKPLYTLAQFSDEATLRPVPAENIPEIRSSYYEVRLLSQSVKIALQNMNQDLTHLRHEVKIDELTGLANRRAFDGMMAEWIASNMPFALIMMDIDHFKLVNDTYGHVMGDEVLRYLARIMQLMSNEDDLCFRYGGEEFGILVKHSGLGRAKEMADRLREQLAVTKSPTDSSITLSAGIAVFPVHGRSAQQLIEKADEALYQSKENGRNRTTVSQLPGA
ncbi:sensor domain-containing diguanylate cyclase [Paenibacillus sp. KQZ6P-2]|uniref:Sensor domain-containing diguanylate cyclase n=1 Tax=Paenibacillus mangrovi TaxID=2931978 RepID=A0A9X1WT04_9BACL|nr:sensor domain-containing diguanylate cyclase [Paenibacillus mangrovi]MCJ8014046.1 sensor domain-containing diguanylate cyclase [Paenibacillus mangrovi]